MLGQRRQRAVCHQVLFFGNRELKVPGKADETAFGKTLAGTAANPASHIDQFTLGIDGFLEASRCEFSGLFPGCPLVDMRQPALAGR